MAAAQALHLVLQEQKWNHNLKDRQIEALLLLAKQESIMVLLPTGYGKSDIMMLWPILFDKLHPCENNHTLLVISPLVSLMTDQVEKFKEAGLSTSIVGEALSGSVSILLLAPEQVAENQLPRIKNVCGVAIDEAHCLSTWGNKFRKAYRGLAVLRAKYPKVPVALLTATMTPSILLDIQTTLGLDKLAMVAEIPDRPNIYIDWGRRDADLSWVSQSIVEKGFDTPKVLIFTLSHKATQRCFQQIVSYLQSKDTDPVVADEAVDIFHGDLDRHTKDHITKEFVKLKSRIRVLISTMAFGMGVGVPDIRHIIHWGPSEDMLSYWQEIGRAGRDGKRSTAHLCDVPRTKVCEQFKATLATTTCIRETLLKGFLLANMDVADVTKLCGGTHCCSNCSHN